MSYPLALLFLLFYLLMCQILPLKASGNTSFLKQKKSSNHIKLCLKDLKKNAKDYVILNKGKL